MKVRIPAQVKEVCDHCSRECHLTKCIVCKKQFCLLCQCYMPGCMVQPDVCKRCDDREDVKKISARYGREILSLANERDRYLSKLKKGPQ